MGDQKTTTIYNDNHGAGLLSKNRVFHNRTKHMDIRHHFFRECIEQGDVEVKYIAITDMPADVLTKGLSAPKHNSCLSKLGLTNIK